MTAEKKKLKVTMLFPITDNDGLFFEREVWGWWLDKINTTFPEGTTELGSPVTGSWRGTNDLNRCLWAIVDEDKLSEIRVFLETAKGKFGQEKMYFEYHRTTYEEVG